MIPISFPEANCTYGAPPDLAESQVMTMAAFVGQVQGGSLDGCQVVVTCWKPTRAESEAIRQGQPVFLSFIGGLPPHFPTLDFHTATHPA